MAEPPVPESGPGPGPGEPAPGVLPDERHELAELVSRVVERGVVLTGDLVVSVADVDLLYVGLDVLLASMDRVDGRGPKLLPGDEEP